MVKIRKNDEVLVISGKHKGQSGKVVSINRKNDLIVIDKVNIVKKHNKPTQNNPDGGITEFEAPIHISNVALKSKGKDPKPVKVGFKIDAKGKKHRINKKTGKDF
ncbi:MAG: 50S ribosomal protein L24 [Mycoplasmatales bacterium]|nr:50S ribosomal protein L24 [Mycoplasmatales bacterium]